MPLVALHCFLSSLVLTSYVSVMPSDINSLHTCDMPEIHLNFLSVSASLGHWNNIPRNQGILLNIDFVQGVFKSFSADMTLEGGGV